MKKIFQIICIFTFLFAAQRASAQADFDKGNTFLNAGIGIGYYYAGGVPIVLSAEFAVNDMISVGPYIGFTSYTNHAASYRYNYTFIDFGARGSYHFGRLIDMNTDNLDLYGGVMLGYVASSYSDNSGYSGYDDPYGGNVRAGIFGGARWYFTPQFSVNGEVGYGVSPLLLGISYKL